MKTRSILWWMLFAGIVCQVFQMININIAIVSMVKQPRRSVSVGFCNVFNASNSRQLPERETIKDDAFDWNEHEQNLIVSSFFWLRWTTPLLGGILSHKYGSKVTFGLSNFVVAALSVTVPFLASISSKLVIVVRVVQGAIGSIGLPAGMATIIGFWAPPDERGRFSSVMLGISIATSAGFPLFGLIQSYLNWKYVFYITTSMGIVWYVMWQYLIYDTPDQHPRISEREKLYIKKSLADSATKENLPIPWKEILTSTPLTINLICNFGQNWGTLALLTYLPLYLRSVHGLDSQKIGTVTGLTYLLKSLLQILGGIVTDSMIRRGMSKTKVRSFAVFVSAVIPGFLSISVLFVKCDVVTSITLLASFIILSALWSSGAQAALIDVSPNFSGVIQGINYTIGIMSGFCGSLVFEYLSSNFDILNTWGYFFLVNGLVNVIPGMLFVLYGDSEQQPWNNPKLDDVDARLNQS